MTRSEAMPESRLRDLIGRELERRSTSWSIGAFGAIAEFHHGAGASPGSRPLERVDVSGAIRITPGPHAVPIAYELLSARPGRWLQGVVLCVPAAHGLMSRRAAVTEIGPDREAIREADREAVVFDLGLGLAAVDFCVRTAEPALIALLRRHAGQRLLEEGDLFERLKQASPHRVAISRLGRIEVYQRIGADGGTSPHGSHTHVLPELLRVRRTQPATVPMPDGHVAGLSLYPESAVQDESGAAKPFDRDAYDRFGAWLEECGDERHVRAKRRLLDLIRAGHRPGGEQPSDRLARNAWRIAVRQIEHLEGPSPALAAWRKVLDRGSAAFDPDAH